MAVHSPARAPVLPGWVTSVSDDGAYRAEVLEPLTDYQRHHGCQVSVNATTEAELDRLCAAQRAYRALVDWAQQASETAAARAPGGSPAAVPGGTQ